jgi:hypothetical protein
MKCFDRLGRLCMSIILALILVLAFSQLVFAQTKAALDGGGIVAVNTQLPLTLGAYSDVDKLNMGSPLWYDDVNNDLKHDPGEPFAAVAQTGWLRPTQAADNSCWLASGVNMLKQLNLISDANSLYMDYALNGVPSPIGTLTWDDGGLQQYVVEYWETQHPAQAANLRMDVLTWSGSLQFGDGHYAWEDVNPRSTVANYLAQGWQVGIGMWPLDGSGIHYGGHALTIQEVPAQSPPPLGTFVVTDSDRDHDWSASGDLNTYVDYTYGPTTYLGHNYYAWFNDFYSGDVQNSWPDGDVGYVVALRTVPEPSACMMLAGMTAILLAWRLRRRT